MGSLIRFLFQNPLVKPILRPCTRFLIGLVAIPLFRMFLKRVIRLQDLDAELEKDLEQWFRGSVVLLAAMANMENFLFSWLYDRVSFVDLQDTQAWIMVGFRLLMAIAAIESMPDQELFAIIHPGPPKLKFSRNYGIFRELREQFRPICRGLICQHVNRSSPVFAILAAIAPGKIGWICYGLAVTQYLIIGLVTSRDKALDALSEFDRQVAARRRELIEEFDLKDQAKQPAAAAAESLAGTGAAPSPAEERPHGNSREGIIAKGPDAGYVSE